MLTSFEKMSGDKLQKYEYSYDKDGYRTTKKYYEDGILQTETVYMWKDGKLVGSNVSDDSGSTIFTIKYIYNGEELVAINLNGGVLLVEKNLQGDITSLYSVDNDEKLFDFYYDAYGNVSFSQENSIIVTIIKALVVILASVAYRGYYYDFDTGLYYLQSRYYDPQTGRFISLDDTQIAIAAAGEPLGANLYAYCENNPVNYCDYTGKKIIKSIDRAFGESDFISKYKIKQNSFNCYGYALGYYKKVDPGFKSNSREKELLFMYLRNNQVDKVANLVISDLNKMYRYGVNVTKSGGVNHKLKHGHQWLIALRISKDDYHFMKKSYNGVWSFKAGIGGPVIELKPGYTPENVSWSTYKKSGKNWVVKNRNYYTSKIIYFVVNG